MTDFNFIDIFTQVFGETFEYLGIDHKFMTEVPESTLNSTENLNTLIGVSGDISGNILFGYTDSIAKSISAKIMGQKEVKEMDRYATFALVDFFADFCNRIMDSIQVDNVLDVAKETKDYAFFASNPTLVSGMEMKGLISKVPSKKLFFKVDGEKFGIAFNLEQKA